MIGNQQRQHTSTSVVCGGGSKYETPKILILCSLCLIFAFFSLPPATKFPLTTFFLYLFSTLFLSLRLVVSSLTLSLCGADGGGWVVIQSQAGCSNHPLLIGFIILTQDLRWERISWPRSAALKAVILMHPRTHTPVHHTQTFFLSLCIYITLLDFTSLLLFSVQKYSMTVCGRISVIEQQRVKQRTHSAKVILHVCLKALSFTVCRYTYNNNMSISISYDARLHPRLATPRQCIKRTGWSKNISEATHTPSQTPRSISGALTLIFKHPEKKS